MYMDTSTSETQYRKRTLSELNLFQHRVDAVRRAAICEYFITVSIQVSGWVVFAKCRSGSGIAAMTKIVQNQCMLDFYVKLLQNEWQGVTYQLIWCWVGECHFASARHPRSCSPTDVKMLERQIIGGGNRSASSGSNGTP